MTPAEIDQRVIPAALETLGMRVSPELRVMILAIGLQESGFGHRAQVLSTGGKGPARGFWQFEQGGVRGVFKHHASMEPLRLLCRARDVAYDVRQIWAQMEFDDIFSCAVARLLLLTDPRPLPGVMEPGEAWRYYLRNWNPGKPHPARWSDNHAAAREVLVGA